MGRKSTSVGFLFLGMGTTFAFFQSPGKVIDLTDKFRMCLI